MNKILKDASAKTYGEPPYGHAELSTLQSYCEKMDLDLQTSMEKLIAAGYTIENSKLQIKDIAQQNNVSQRKLLNYLMPEPQLTGANLTEVLRIPDELSGVGRLTLEDLREQYNVDTDNIIIALKAQGIIVDTETKLKTLAEQQKISAHDLFDKIREINNQDLVIE